MTRFWIKFFRSFYIADTSKFHYFLFSLICSQMKKYKSYFVERLIKKNEKKLLQTSRWTMLLLKYRFIQEIFSSIWSRQLRTDIRQDNINRKKSNPWIRQALMNTPKHCHQRPIWGEIKTRVLDDVVTKTLSLSILCLNHDKRKGYSSFVQI